MVGVTTAIDKIVLKKASCGNTVALTIQSMEDENGAGDITNKRPREKAEVCYFSEVIDAYSDQYLYE